MTSKLSLIAVVAIALLSSACGIVVSSGPDQNRPERFEFVPVPATRAEAVEAFRNAFGDDPAMLVEDSVTPIGKLVTGQGAVVFADFEAVFPDTGLNECSGSASEFSSGWGCRPADDPVPEDPAPRQPLQSTMVGSTGTWSEAEFSVNDDVDHLIAIAEDGTTYRLEPLDHLAWMEWKTEHGDLVVTAFDGAGDELASVDVQAR